MNDLLKKLMVSAAIRVFVKSLRFESLPEFFRLCFLFRRHDFCYDHMTPLFVHSFMQFQLNCMCDVIFRT